jgi:hypothetical protein
MRCFTVGHRIAIAIFIASLAGGCMSELTEQGADSSVEIDQSAVLAEAARYRDTTAFDHASSKSYPSALGTTSYIQLYANRTAMAEYPMIDPDKVGSNAVIPVGGIIVREVLDTNGTAQRLTIMAKGPAGYNPAIGDWFWAVTDLQGTPIVEDGVARAGRLADCYGCHLPRATDDFLFGVPLIDRGAVDGSGSGTEPPQGGDQPVCGDWACEGGETKDTCPHDCKHGHH